MKDIGIKKTNNFFIAIAVISLILIFLEYYK